MNRRGFLGSILALSAAPAIVRAQSIMRVRPIVHTWTVTAEGGLLVPAEMSGPMLRLLSAAGVLLAEIPLQADSPPSFVGMGLRGTGFAQAAGTFERAELVAPFLSEPAPIPEFRLSSDCLVVGDRADARITIVEGGPPLRLLSEVERNALLSGLL